jgi:hypothetical protein
MFSIEELTGKFNSMTSEQQAGVYQELTTNIHVYSQIMPNLPLIKYIVGGDSAVPVNQHGPIITRYKEWVATQK